jgi:hypothetical protein
MLYGKHLVAFSPVIGQRATIGRLGAIGVGKLFRREVTEFVQYRCPTCGQTLRHLCVGFRRPYQLRGHEIDEFPQAAAARICCFLGQKPPKEGHHVLEYPGEGFILDVDEVGFPSGFWFGRQALGLFRIKLVDNQRGSQNIHDEISTGLFDPFDLIIGYFIKMFKHWFAD